MEIGRIEKNAGTCSLEQRIHLWRSGIGDAGGGAASRC